MSLPWLFSYRVVLAEIRKKEKNIDLFKTILRERESNGFKNSGELDDNIRGSEYGIKDLTTHRKDLENELKKSNNQDYIFKTFEYPLIKVYGSAVFSPLDHLITNPEQEEPLNVVFIHIIPYNDKLHILVGYNTNFTSDWIEKYVAEWDNLTQVELEIKLTDLFATRIDNWGMSVSLFEKVNKEKIIKLENYVNKNANNYQVNQQIDFNIFN